MQPDGGSLGYAPPCEDAERSIRGGYRTFDDRSHKYKGKGNFGKTVDLLKIWEKALKLGIFGVVG